MASAGGEPGEDCRSEPGAAVPRRPRGWGQARGRAAGVSGAGCAHRAARARAVEDRNQESARTDVREMEGSLERVRASIAEVARKLSHGEC